jgi:protein-glutamine gamma-glutamyltransferase
VRNSDAHAWVEAWFPTVGWYEFDPTFAVPPAEPQLSSSVPLARAFEAIVSTLKNKVPGGIITGAISLVGVVVVAGLAWIVWRRRRRTADPKGTPSGVVAERPPGPATYAFRKLEGAAAARGQGREPPETAAELLRRAADLNAPDTREALRTFERERYGNRPPSPQQIERAVREFDRLSDPGPYGQV